MRDWTEDRARLCEKKVEGNELSMMTAARMGDEE